MTMVSPAERTHCIIACFALGIDQADHRRRHALVEMQLPPSSAHSPTCCRRLAPSKPALHARIRQWRSREPTAMSRAPAIRRIVRALRFRHQFNTRRRPFALMPIVSLAFGRHFDPAATPCSHSCTVGKYSVLFGFRPSVRKVLMTNSSRLWPGNSPPLHTTPPWRHQIIWYRDSRIPLNICP